MGNAHQRTGSGNLQRAFVSLSRPASGCGMNRAPEATGTNKRRHKSVSPSYRAFALCPRTWTVEPLVRLFWGRKKFVIPTRRYRGNGPPSTILNCDILCDQLRDLPVASKYSTVNNFFSKITVLKKFTKITIRERDKQLFFRRDRLFTH